MEILVVEVKTRAEEVVNGFKRVTDRMARDVLTLIALLEAKDIENKNLKASIVVLEKKIAGLELMKVESDYSRSHPFESAFKDIFKKDY